MPSEQMAAIRDKMIASGAITVPVDHEPAAEQAEVPETEEKLAGDDNHEQAPVNAQDESTPEGIDEGEAVEETPETVSEDPTDTYTPQTLAEAIGWEASDLYEAVMLPLGENDEPVPLGQIKDKLKDIIRDNKQLADSNAQLQEVANQAQSGMGFSQQLSQEMVQAQGYLASIDRMESQTDWAELESVDPAEAALKRQKFQQARQEVAQHMQGIQAKEQQLKGSMMQAAEAKMHELIPEWKDEGAMKSDQGEIRTLLHGYGFADNEINNIMDPRQMQLGRDMMLWAKERAEAGKAVEKVRQAPKVLRGTGRFKQDNSNSVKKKAVAQAKTTRNRGDQLNAAKAILSAGMKRR